MELLLQLFFQNPFIVSGVLTISVTLIIVLRNWNNNGSNLKLPPSPPRLPIIGNLHQLVGKSPHRALRRLSEKHGPLMLLRLGQTPTVVVSSPDVVREIVKSHDVAFSDRPRSAAADVLFYGGENIGFSPYGEFWRGARRICALQLLTLKRVQSFQPIREQEVAAVVDSLRAASGFLNLSRILVAASNNIVSRCILGQSYNAEKDGTKSKLGEMAKRIAVDLVAFNVGDFFPSLRWIDTLRGFTIKMESTARVLDEFYNRVIEEHDKAMKDSSSDSSKDFVDILLQLQRDPKLIDFELTPRHVKAILQDMFLGGIETSSTTMEWIMAELLRNPRVMKKVQGEVRRVAGHKANVDTDDINQMTYLKCVVKETLRLHPPFPLLVPRETSKASQIGGYDIPSKTRVLINSWAIHRHPNSWNNPDEFLPERFQSEPINLKNQDCFELIPFGFGRRQCPGMTFGTVTVEYVIASLLCCFDWKLRDDELPENLDMSEVYGLTVNKKLPLYVMPTHYTPI